MALSSKMTRGRRARPSSRVAGWSAAPRALRRAPHALSHVQAVGVRALGTTTASGQHGRPALDDFAEVSTAARRCCTSRDLASEKKNDGCFEAPLPIFSRCAPLSLVRKITYPARPAMRGVPRMGVPAQNTSAHPHPSKNFVMGARFVPFLDGSAISREN